MSHGFTDAEVANYRALFNEFDLNKNGTVQWC